MRILLGALLLTSAAPVVQSCGHPGPVEPVTTGAPYTAPAPTSSPVAASAIGTAGPATAASAAPAAGARCLPVVNKECGCTWECAAGAPAGKDEWTVRPAFWRGTELRARIDRWCVGADCTEAFFIKLDACDGKCVPRAADPGCHFEGERCLGGS